MNIKPLFDRVVIKPIPETEKTKGGILLPTTAQEKPQIGKVIAVGDGTTSDGKQTAMQVKIGDTVIYPKYAGNEFKADDGETLILIRQTELLGIKLNTK